MWVISFFLLSFLPLFFFNCISGNNVSDVWEYWSKWKEKTAVFLEYSVMPCGSEADEAKPWQKRVPLCVHFFLFLFETQNPWSYLFYHKNNYFSTLWVTRFRLKLLLNDWFLSVISFFFFFYFSALSIFRRLQQTLCFVHTRNYCL